MKNWNFNFSQRTKFKMIRTLLKRYDNEIKSCTREIIKTLNSCELNFDKEVRTTIMYVSKDNHNKGMKSFNKKEFTKYRTVEFLSEKEYKDELKLLDKMNNCFLELPFENNMHGFLKKKNIFTAQHAHGTEFNSICNMDLVNAFNQIGGGDVYYVLRHLFDLSKYKARYITNLVVGKDGNLYQGNILAPLLYNIFTWALAINLNSFVANSPYRNRINLYADDILITSEIRLSYSYLKRIKKIINEWGFHINMKKTTISSSHTIFRFNGYVYNKDVKHFRPYKMKKFRSKIRNISHILFDFQSPTIINKFGQEVNTKRALMGYLNFAKDLNRLTLNESEYLAKLTTG